MPRKPSGSALSGAERIRHYRERLKAAGKVQTWAAPGEEITDLEPRNARSLIEHWERAVEQLVAVQRAARARETWLDKLARSDSITWHEAVSASGEEADRKLDLILNETDLRTIRLSRRPRSQRLSRAARWQHAVGELSELVSEYGIWLENLPEAIRMASGPLVEKLEAVIELADQISELEGVDLPVGWGRD